MNINRGDMAQFAESYPQEDFFMQQARKNGMELGAHDPSAGVGSLIALLVRSCGATSIVEVGTGSGVGGLWIFKGADSSAVLTSIDSEREHAASAKEFFEEAGISSQRFRLITGRAIDVARKLADTNYDLMIVRSPEDIVDVVQESYRLLTERGVLIIDNALDGGRVADPTQRDFQTIARRDAVKSIKDDSRWQSTLIPFGGGILIAIKSA